MTERDMVAREVWNDYCKSGQKPDNIPERPDEVYVDEWISWSHWLGWDK